MLLLLPLSLAAAYWHTLAAMWRRWFPAWGRTDLNLYHRMVDGESYYTHGPLMVLVSLVLAILLIRYTRIAVQPRGRLGGSVLAGSLLVHLVGGLARVNFVSAFSLIGALVGLILLLWGVSALRRLWFAVAILVFMVPLPEVTIADLNFRLKIFAADGGVRLANLVGVIAVRSGNQAFLEGDKSLVIANVCNGLRTLISLLAFGALYAYVCRLRGTWRIVLFLLTLPVAVVANAVRVVGLIVLADRFGVEAATGWFHDVSGLMIFAIALGMMFGLEKLILRIQLLRGRSGAVAPLFHEVRRGEGDRRQWSRLQAPLARRGAAAAALLLLLTGGISWHLHRTVSPSSQAGLLKEVLPDRLRVNGRLLRGHERSLDQRALALLETPDYLYRR
ncbi:MAG TPA: exosortase/archaeosortase family protein, partial [Phycisphaerae bacterium]|nr:exosortase/archaeosortase family protein [Phycisphaerae bacterium]